MAVMACGTRMSVSSDIKDVFTISLCREIVMKFPVSYSVYYHNADSEELRRKNL